MRSLTILVLVVSALVVSAAADQPAKAPRLDSHGDPLPDGALVRLGTVRFQLLDSYHPNSFRFRFSEPTLPAILAPDGATLVTTMQGEQGVTHLYFMDTATGKNSHKHDLKGVASLQHFAPDGKGLVFGGSLGLQFVDAATGKVTRSVEMKEMPEGILAFSADGKRVAAQPQKQVADAAVRIWDTADSKEAASLPGRGNWCKGLAFGPDGNRLLLWSVVPTQVSANSMSFGSDSKVFLACIDVPTRKIIGETTIGYAHQAALSPDGETVAAESDDHQSVRIRHLPTNKERCSIAVKNGRFQFTPDGKGLFTIDEAGRAALWDAAKGEKIRDCEGALANKDFRILGISKDGGTIVALDGGWNSAAAVVVWKTATGKRVDRPPSHEGTVTCLAYAPDGKALVSGSIDRTVRLWNPATGEHVRVVATHKEAITAVAFSPDGKRVASSSQAGLTQVCTVEGKLVTELPGPAKGATALTFSRDGKVLYAGGQAPEVLGWEVASAREVVRLKTGDDGAVMALGDGGTVAVTANGEIRAERTPERLQIWNPTKTDVAAVPFLLRDERGGEIRCEAATISASGRLIASSQISVYQGIRPSYGAAQLRVWERTSGQPIRTLAPVVTRLLAFSPDARYLAAGGIGQSGHLRVGYGSGIDVWDTVSGEKAGVLPVSPECIVFSPDGRYLATGGRDHGVLIWEAPGLRPAADAKAPMPQE